MKSGIIHSTILSCSLVFSASAQDSVPNSYRDDVEYACALTWATTTCHYALIDRTNDFLDSYATSLRAKDDLSLRQKCSYVTNGDWVGNRRIFGSAMRGCMMAFHDTALKTGLEPDPDEYSEMVNAALCLMEGDSRTCSGPLRHTPASQ